MNCDPVLYLTKLQDPDPVPNQAKLPDLDPVPHQTKLSDQDLYQNGLDPIL